MNNEMPIYATMHHRLGLSENQSLVHVAVRNNRVEIRDLTHLFPLLELRASLEEFHQHQLDQLREFKQMIREGQVQLLEQISPGKGKRYDHATLRLHGQMRKEVAALPQESVKITHEGREVDVELQPEHTDRPVAWQVDEVAMERFLDELIQQKEYELSMDLAKTKGRNAATSERSQRTSQPIQTQQKVVTPESTRTHEDARRLKREGKAHETPNQQAAKQARTREDTIQRDKVKAQEADRELTHGSQGRGSSQPIKKIEASESTTEQIQRDEH